MFKLITEKKYIFFILFFFICSFCTILSAADDSDEIDDEFEEAVKKGDLKKPDEIKDVEKLEESSKNSDEKSEKINSKESSQDVDTGDVDKAEEIEDYKEGTINFNKSDIDSPLPYRGKSALAAFALSFFLGFGAGNFYSENMSVAYATLLTEVVGLGVGVGGWVMLYMATDPEDPTGVKPLDYDIYDSELLPEEMMAIAGTAIFAVAKVIDITAAVLSTREYNRSIKSRLMSKRKIEPYTSGNCVGITVHF